MSHLGQETRNNAECPTFDKEQETMQNVPPWTRNMKQCRMSHLGHGTRNNAECPTLDMEQETMQNVPQLVITKFKKLDVSGVKREWRRQ
jgi:hypothetical protein